MRFITRNCAICILPPPLGMLSLLPKDLFIYFIRNTFSKFHRRHYKLISKFYVELKMLLRVGLSEPEFYGDLIYKGLICLKLGYFLIDKYVTFEDENALFFIIIVFLHILIVNDIVYVNFNICLGIHISKHKCNTHRLKSNLLLNLYCISINTST